MAPPSDASPQVLVIVPARNEEANLERCLRSLVVQKGIPFAVFVVNDSSTDRTQAIAESFTRVRQCPFIGLNQDLVDVQVLAAPAELPTGTNGKVQAMIAGEQFARAAFPEAKWLLFTDADTEHLEGSLAAAVAEATEAKADLLSYSPEQLLTGIRQQLVMPVLFGELAFDYSPRRVSDPSFPMLPPTANICWCAPSRSPRSAAWLRSPMSFWKTLPWRASINPRASASSSAWAADWFAPACTTPGTTFAWAGRRTWRCSFPRLAPWPRAAARVLPPHPLRRLRPLLEPSGRRPRRHTVDWLVFVALGVLWFYAFTNFALFYLRISRAHFSVLSTFLSPLGLPCFPAC